LGKTGSAIAYASERERRWRYVRRVSYPRPLNETEKAVLLRVFELNGARELDALTEQVEAGIATRPCDCPCPSVSLAVDRARARPIAHHGRLELEVYYDGGAVMVWVDDGWLSNLETMWWSDDPPREFPALDGLRLTPPE
jgi:hypothetical protein